MIPIAPASKPSGHTMVARVKKTASSVLSSALTALCKMAKIGNPTKEASASSKNTFNLLSTSAFAVKTSSVTPRPVMITPTEIKKT